MSLLVLDDVIEINEQITEAVIRRGLFNHIFSATTIKSALEIARAEEISVFIVDISLPDGSGYDFIKSIRSMPQYELAWIIIVTGIDESKEEIIDAYNSSQCHRYLKKPFSMAYLTDMLEELIYKKVTLQDQVTRLKIRRKSIDYFFDHDDIVYIETVDKTAYIYTKMSKHAIGRVTLSELEEQLPSDKFVRVHRSFIINKDYIDQITKHNNQSQIKIKHYSHMIPIGRTYRDNYSVL